MALEKDVPEIYTITLALSDIMRYSLSFSKEAVPLSEEIQYLKSYITIQNERFGQKICLRLHLAPETEECLIPKLILQPLVENSFEHGLLNKGGRWELSIESSLTETDDLLIVVKDNGIGFEKERLEEIRRKLSAETDEALRSGSHIGLANVHARIKLHSRNEAHGISIVSSAQEGTSIRVLMPAQWKRRNRMSYKVVIVDDEPCTRGVILKLGHWDDLDMEVVGEAADGEIALELITRLLPDVVITDVRMPRLDGLELAQRLRKQGWQKPILVVSGYDDYSYVRSALKSGVTDYILKPVKSQELNQQLQRCAELLQKKCRKALL